MWAQVTGETIVAVSLDDPLDGWVEVTPTPRPMDTVDHTWDVGVEMVDGLPTQAWISRPWRDGELSDELRDLLVISDAHVEYSEQIAGGIEAMDTARHRLLDSAASNGGVDCAAKLATDLAGWSPSGDAAAELIVLRDFLARLVAFSSWQGEAWRGAEILGRWSTGIAEAV